MHARVGMRRLSTVQNRINSHQKITILLPRITMPRMTKCLKRVVAHKLGEHKQLVVRGGDESTTTNCRCGPFQSNPTAPTTTCVNVWECAYVYVCGCTPKVGWRGLSFRNDGIFHTSRLGSFPQGNNPSLLNTRAAHCSALSSTHDVSSKVDIDLGGSIWCRPRPWG